MFDGNLWLVTQQKPRRNWSPPQVISHLGCLDLLDRGATCIPAWLQEDGAVKANLKQAKYGGEQTAQHYLDRLALGVEDLFHHVLAVLHDPAYRGANAGALRMEWPRIPLPGWPDGTVGGAAAVLSESAERGRALAALLDLETPVSGVTQGPLRHEIASIGVPATISERNMSGQDFAVTAGWGHRGTGDVVMPGQGRAVERVFTPQERAALGNAMSAFGETTFDIYLNGSAFWRNVPAAVWNYRLGGYQVLKKWLSYREQSILGRTLQPDEIQQFTDTARRTGAILTLVRSERSHKPSPTG